MTAAATVARSEHDVVVIGGGPNGLSCAAYLARAGAKVAVVEKRFEWGGTLSSDDYSTPFHYNIGQFLLPLGKSSPPYADLELASEGVRFVEPKVIARLRLDGTGSLSIDRSATGLAVGFDEAIDLADDLVTPLLFRFAPRESDVRRYLHEQGAKRLLEFAELSPGDLAARGVDDRASALLRYLTVVAGYLDAQQSLGLMGIYLLSRLFRGAIVVGGSKAIANGLYRVATQHGTEILTQAEAVAVSGDDSGRVVELHDGRRLRARAVVSTLGVRASLVDLPEPDLADRFRPFAEQWRTPDASFFTTHVGVKAELGKPKEAPALMEVFGVASVADVETHVRASRDGHLRETPTGHACVTSLHDPRQASAGPYGPLHTLRVQTLTPVDLPDGWDGHRRTHRATAYAAAADALGIAGDVRPLFQFADSPRDIERRFRVAGGWPHQGELTTGQTFDQRPHPACSSSRTPLTGYYLGGSAAYPGVPGSLAGGYLAATAVAEDLGLSQWWQADRSRRS